MPLYTYTCCNEEWESFRTINNRRRERCKKCDTKATIVIKGTSRPVIMEYYDNGLGTQVTGPKQRQRLMRERGVEETG